jgi:hypothetical protein
MSNRRLAKSIIGTVFGIAGLALSIVPATVALADSPWDNPDPIVVADSPWDGPHGDSTTDDDSPWD